MNCVQNNKIGKFIIDQETIRNWPYYIIKDIFSHILVVKAENNYFNKTIEYYGYSELFKPIIKGVAIPNYYFYLDKNANMQCLEGEGVTRIINIRKN